MIYTNDYSIRFMCKKFSYQFCIQLFYNEKKQITVLLFIFTVTVHANCDLSVPSNLHTIGMLDTGEKICCKLIDKLTIRIIPMQNLKWEI